MQDRTGPMRRAFRHPRPPTCGDSGFCGAAAPTTAGASPAGGMRKGPDRIAGVLPRMQAGCPIIGHCCSGRRGARPERGDGAARALAGWRCAFSGWSRAHGRWIGAHGRACPVCALSDARAVPSFAAAIRFPGPGRPAYPRRERRSSAIRSRTSGRCGSSSSRMARKMRFLMPAASISSAASGAAEMMMSISRSAPVSRPQR